MEANIKVGYFLPGRIVVYRHEGGTAGLLIGLVNDARLADLAREVEGNCGRSWTPPPGAAW